MRGGGDEGGVPAKEYSRRVTLERMSLASRFGKLRLPEESNDERAHRQEDLLTADVFGALRYLPFREGLGPVLAAAKTIDGVDLASWSKDKQLVWEEFSEAKLLFWPRVAGHEPDLLVLLRRADEAPALAVLIEVKLHAEQHSIDGVSQLGFYTRSLLDGMLQTDLEEALPSLLPAVLLTADADVPAEQLHTARQELAALEERTEAFWVGWRDVAAVVHRLLDRKRDKGAPAHELALLEDLEADLAERGFPRPRSLTSFPLPALAPLGPLAALPAFRSEAPPRTFAQLRGLSLGPCEPELRAWRLR